MAKKLDAKDVELYLLENTDFFVSRESLVSELSFKHDADGATSLLEMQVRKLRDEQSRLMDMLSGFVSTGKENEELFFKSKNLTLSWIASKNFDEVKFQKGPQGGAGRLPREGRLGARSPWQGYSSRP